MTPREKAERIIGKAIAKVQSQADDLEVREQVAKNAAKDNFDIYGIKGYAKAEAIAEELKVLNDWLDPNEVQKLQIENARLSDRLRWAEALLGKAQKSLNLAGDYTLVRLIEKYQEEDKQ